MGPKEWLTPPRFPETWADGYGEDDYGYWMSFAVNGVRQVMRFIEPGIFRMGEAPGHTVELTQGFWLGETTCTQELWREVMGENPSRFRGENLPVENVSWNDCQRFLETLNDRKPGLNPLLPTEAEWEYACRARSIGAYCFGEDDRRLSEYAWFGDSKGGETHPVGSKTPNDWGLYDMHGNVWEWCRDWYGAYPDVPMVDPVGPDSGSNRVLRGGAWFNGAGYCRSAYRFCPTPGYRYGRDGFRLARGQHG